MTMKGERRLWRTSGCDRPLSIGMLYADWYYADRFEIVVQVTTTRRKKGSLRSHGNILFTRESQVLKGLTVS